RRLDRQTRLEPGVASDVEALLAELLDAARDDVLDLGGVDARAPDDLGVGRRQQRVRVDVLVVALLAMPAPDGRAHRLDDDDLSTRLRHERSGSSRTRCDLTICGLTGGSINRFVSASQLLSPYEDHL